MTFQAGQWVIYTKIKVSCRYPGRKARKVRPSKRGETYTYSLEKHWQVLQQSEEGIVWLLTPKGNVRWTRANDRRLRLARWWERFCYCDQFPQTEQLHWWSRWRRMFSSPQTSSADRKAQNDSNVKFRLLISEDSEGVRPEDHERWRA